MNLVGKCIHFKGVSGIDVFGFICKVNSNNGEVSYVRDSLTRWIASEKLIENANEIPLSYFIEKVKENALKSNRYPAENQILKVLDLYKENFNRDIEEIHKILK